jgi:nitrilase
VNVQRTVALVSEVFFGQDAESRLGAALVDARARGADVVVLPELGLDPWVPATRQAREGDAEPLGGPRTQRLVHAARAAGVGVVTTYVVSDGGSRLNTAVFVDARGEIVARYAKTHVPQEPGFWERDHYDDGTIAASPFEHGGVKWGMQICSDVMRPMGIATLAAAGAHVVLHPRASEPDTWDPWRCVLRAAALTSGCWVLTVNRPRDEGGTPLGGPSCAIAPDGTIVVESTEPVTMVTIDTGGVEAARTAYPGYLPLATTMYAEAWSRVPPKPSAQ